MNKKYYVNSESNVILINEYGELIEREDKYTKNTDRILSLEDAIDNLENNIDLIKDELIQLDIKSKNSKYTIKIALLIGFVPIILLVLLPIKLILSNILNTLAIVWIISNLIVVIREVRTLMINNKTIKKYHQKIIDESSKIRKVSKKIDMLSKDKTPIKKENPYQFEEVKKIYNFNFDPSDYFIERYQIDKRTKEMNKGKKKIRKITKKVPQINNNLYDI